MEMNDNNENRTYSNYYGQQNNPYSNSSQTVNTQSVRKNKKSGALKKIVIGALTGLFFGVFAGLGFQAINLSTNAIKGILPDNAVEKAEDILSTEKVKEDDDLSKIEATDDAESADKNIISETMNAIFDNDEESLQSSELKQTPVKVSTDVTEVAAKVMPSVVSVSNKYTAKMNYFGQTFAQHGESAGSGIIVGKNDSELLIVSNNHVVDGAEELSVCFADNEVCAAQIKGTDADRDLAVIAVQLSDIDKDTMNKIAIAELGDSEALTVGEPVVAIGNSLGYGQSVTTGVVSALHRQIGEMSSDTDSEAVTFIQTDAAINPGNSGGALVNMFGQVIGINSNKIGGSVVEGMGYAIPISDAEPIIKELMNKQTKLRVSEASRGKLGITGVNVEEQYSEIYGMPVGVYVSSVDEGSGAEAAGLVRGDIIVAVNGEKIDTMDKLKAELEYYAAGSTIELTIMQGSPEGYKAKTVNVTLTAKES